MDLGNTIKEYRIQKGYKQNEFAEKCHLTQAYLSKIESNQKEPALSVLRTISSVLQVPLPIPANTFLSLIIARRYRSGKERSLRNNRPFYPRHDKELFLRIQDRRC
jgi:transcriptional regulator with XRE-family HTH domain